MKVTFCSYDKPGSVGGPFSWIRSLLPALRDRGIDCRCLFLTHFSGTGPVVEGLRRDGFSCPTVDCHPRTVDQVRWLLTQLAKDPPDIFVPNFVVAGLHASRWIRHSGIPTVGVLHSDDDFYRAIQDEFVSGSRKRALSAVVCVSSEIEGQVLRRQPQVTSVERIPYGVQVPSTTATHGGDRFRIAYVGRLAEEQKRISDVTRAMIRTCRAVPNTEAVIYGDGPDRSNVERILREEGRDVPVQLAGNVPNARMQQELANCSVITLLSDYEGLPIAMLEGMACGCVPVYLRTRSGTDELIRHNESGLIVSDREAAFTSAIAQLAGDRALCQRLGNAARATIVEEYSQTRSADLWASHLAQLAMNSRPDVLRVPRRITLATRNSCLEKAEQRSTPLTAFQRTLRKTRMFAGKIRRRIF